MEYGVRLTRHVLRQVFGNLGQAARITLAPILVFLALFSVLAAPALTALMEVAESGAMTPDANGEIVPPENLPTGGLGMVLLLLPVGLIVFSWVAVGWHRFVLLEEYPLGVVPRWSFDRVLGYLGRSVILGGILIAVFVVSTFVTAIFAQALGDGVFIPLLIAIAVLMSWTFVRMGLILPGAAIDQPLRIAESWGITGRAASEILVPIVAFAIGFTLLGQLVALVLGAGFVGVIGSAAVSWLQMLCNLALLTTLYGNLVERRELL